MEINKKDNSIFIKNSPTSFILLDFIEFNTILDVFKGVLPNQHNEVFKYIFNRIKDLNENDIKEIFNDINFLNKEADKNISNRYLAMENKKYELFISPASRLKEIINKQELNNNMNWANYFNVLALSLIGGVSKPGPIIENLIKFNSGNEELYRQNLAGELAAYAMEAVDCAESYHKEFSQKAEKSRQTTKAASERHSKTRALNIKLCGEYLKNYQEMSNADAARKLYKEHKNEIESTFMKYAKHEHRIQKQIKDWKKLIKA